MKYDPSTLKGKAKAAAYDYKKGWSSTAQPFYSQDVADYHAIAEMAAPQILEQVKSFCDENGFSYIVIPYEDFQDYERSPLNFRDCLKAFCKKENESARKSGENHPPLSPNVDFAITGPRVKTLQSAARKTETGEKTPDRIKDYVGIQLTALKSTTGKKNKRSLTLLEKAMKAMEKNPRTRGIKNRYWEPDPKTGFRGYKSLWVADSLTPNDLPASEILAEIKIEHESQMDIDKLTRKFMDIDRVSKKAQITFSKASCHSDTSKQTTTITKRMKAMNSLGRTLYDRAFADAGIDTFLNPNGQNQTSSFSAKALLDLTKTTIAEHFPRGTRTDMVQKIADGMSLFPRKKSQSKTRKPNRS